MTASTVPTENLRTHHPAFAAASSTANNLVILRFTEVLASGMQLALVTIFIICVLLKVRVLLDVEETMAESLWSRFYFGSFTTLVCS